MTHLPDDIQRILDELETEDGPLTPADAQSATDSVPAHHPARRRRGLYLTPKQSFLALAAALSLVLLALVAYLLWLLVPGGFSTEGGKESAGIIPELAIYGPGRGDTPRFSKPMGAAWGADGKRIYVADTRNNRVVAFRSNGRFLFEMGGFGIAKPLPGARRTWNPGELNYPTDVAVDSDGNIYVADFYNDSISVFNSDGEYLRRFPDPYKPVGRGSSGREGGGIAVTALTVQDGLVYATDEYQVFVFKTDGTLVRQFGRPGNEPGSLDRPGGIAVSSNGTVFVSDSNHNRVTAFSPAGTVLWNTGAPVSGLRSETDNPFVLPRGLALFRDGSLLAADPLGQQVVRMGENGAVFASFGVRGAVEGEVNFPNDVDTHGERVLIADRENNRVQVVRLSSR